jgi:DNA repair ATPase RecN
MEIQKLYINLNSCLIDLQNNQKHQNAQLSRCNDYYNCVRINSHLVEQYKRLSPEISRNFDNQHFDINALSQNFKQIEAINIKIHDLQHAMPEIRKYLNTEAENIELERQQLATDLHFKLMDETEEWIDSVLYELDRKKQERINRIEKWKSAGKAILKFIGKVVGFFFTLLWRMINGKEEKS